MTTMEQNRKIDSSTTEIVLLTMVGAVVLVLAILGIFS